MDPIEEVSRRQKDDIKSNPGHAHNTQTVYFNPNSVCCLLISPQTSDFATKNRRRAKFESTTAHMHIDSAMDRNTLRLKEWNEAFAGIKSILRH